MASVISAVEPARALPGARITVRGANLPLPDDGPPRVLVGDHPAQIVAASTRFVRLLIPEAAEGGVLTIRFADLPDDGGATVRVGRTLTTGVHQVDSPAFDDAGRLYVTHSGGRDTKVAVPLYRVGRDGVREPLAVEIPNPTSLAVGPDGLLYVSSRFDGHVYRLTADDKAERYASELGVPTGLAFGTDGALFVGDRSGTIFRVSTDKHVEAFATIPASVAAFHLAFGPDGCLYVAAPTLATHDGLYRITPDGSSTLICDAFGRPQGLVFDQSGALLVVEALAGMAGLYRVEPTRPDARPVCVVSAPALVGVAIDPAGGLALASGDTVWALDADV